MVKIYVMIGFVFWYYYAKPYSLFFLSMPCFFFFSFFTHLKISVYQPVLLKILTMYTVSVRRAGRKLHNDNLLFIQQRETYIFNIT